MNTTGSIGGDEGEHALKTGTVRSQFDYEKTPASMAVIETLAEVLDTDPVELTPLHSTVDPDALDALVRVRNGRVGDTHITFTHEGQQIDVHSYGVITVQRQCHEIPTERSERTTEK